jgi:hypothetical protein
MRRPYITARNASEPTNAAKLNAAAPTHTFLECFHDTPSHCDMAIVNHDQSNGFCLRKIKQIRYLNETSSSLTASPAWVKSAGLTPVAVTSGLARSTDIMERHGAIKQADPFYSQLCFTSGLIFGLHTYNQRL